MYWFSSQEGNGIMRKEEDASFQAYSSNPSRGSKFPFFMLPVYVTWFLMQHLKFWRRRPYLTPKHRYSSTQYYIPEDHYSNNHPRGSIYFYILCLLICKYFHWAITWFILLFDNCAVWRYELQIGLIPPASGSTSNSLFTVSCRDFH
jgi:hypothetical protein